MAKLSRFSALHQPTAKVTKRKSRISVAAPPPEPPPFPPPSGDIYGIITVGTNGIVYGVQPEQPGMFGGVIPGCGSITVIPDMLPDFKYTGYADSTYLFLNDGSYGGFDVVDGQVVGAVSYDITVDGITVNFPAAPYGGIGPIPGDPFGFATKVGQYLYVSITILYT